MYSVHIPRCTHIKTNGTQCGSPALRGRRFCFFHKNWQGQRIQLNAKLAENFSFTLPVLEDADSVQVALMQVMRLILSGQLEARTAGLLLYALQTASLNLRQMKLEPRKRETVIINPSTVADNGVDDNLWQARDFEEEVDEEDGEEDAEEEVAEEEKPHLATTAPASNDRVETGALAGRQPGFAHHDPDTEEFEPDIDRPLKGVIYNARALKELGLTGRDSAVKEGKPALHEPAVKESKDSASKDLALKGPGFSPAVKPNPSTAASAAEVHPANPARKPSTKVDVEALRDEIRRVATDTFARAGIKLSPRPSPAEKDTADV